MIEHDQKVRAAAEAASELLLDLGDYVTSGRRPPRRLRWLAWMITLLAAAALWRWFPWLFDNQPAWAIIAAGSWVLWLVVTLGIWSTGIKYDSPEVAKRDGDTQAKEG